MTGPAKRWIAAVVALSLVAALVVFGLRSMSERETGNEVVTDQIQCDASRRTLLVVVHGLGGDVERLRGVIALAREKIPGADVLAPKYPVGWLSNSDPFQLADRLEAAIGRQFSACEDRGTAYEKVVLVGYSAGALLARKAFVYAIGDIQDHPSLAGSIARPRQKWADKVERIVLIAGMNRGWSLDRRLEGMALHDHVAAKAATPLAKLAGVSRFVFMIENGAPFVANLRLQWVRAVARDGARFPTVVQILGKGDEFVSRDDEKDLPTAAGAFLVDGGSLNHTNIADVKANPSARDAMIKALTLDKDAPGTAAQAIKRNPEDERISHLIFVRHGIRDFGGWMDELEARLCATAGAAGRPCKDSGSGSADGKLTRVDIDRYGYFGMLPFLIPRLRQEKVREFMDAYTEAVARIGNPDLRVDFVGHSHGTYLLSSGLSSYKALKVNRVVFANSVANTRYRWNELSGQGETNRVRSIRNYEGSRDWVVAIFPRLFEDWDVEDLGSAGFIGFEKKSAVSSVRLEGSHDIGVAPDNHQSIADYLFDRPGGTPPKVESNYFILQLWKFPALGWFLALALGVLVVVLIARLLRPLTRRLPEKLDKPVRWSVASLVLFGILVNI